MRPGLDKPTRAGGAGRQGAGAEVDAVGVGGQGDVDAVMDDQRAAVFAGGRAQLAGDFVDPLEILDAVARRIEHHHQRTDWRRLVLLLEIGRIEGNRLERRDFLGAQPLLLVASIELDLGLDLRLKLLLVDAQRVIDVHHLIGFRGTNIHVKLR